MLIGMVIIYAFVFAPWQRIFGRNRIPPRPLPPAQAYAAPPQQQLLLHGTAFVCC